MLQGTRNRHGGIYLVPADLPADDADFAAQLAAALTAWTTEGLALAWLTVPAGRPGLIAPALALGFEFHHCTPAQLTLTRRLREAAYIPGYASHTVGVGAVVLNGRDELLTVVERRDLVARPGYFKLPGGMLERGEHIADGVVREVFEETGVRAEFQGLLSLRHHHQGQFATSNLYLVARLRPLSETIAIDEREIGLARWMPVAEFLACASVGPYNKRVVQAALDGGVLAAEELAGYMDAAKDYEIFVSPPA